MEIRRILLAVDAGEDGDTALRTAVTLGAALQAELDALFVEDADLLRVAQLPFVREMLSVSANQRALAPASMERALRLQAERMRRLLAERAAAAGVRWSFSVARGLMRSELLARAEATDLVIVSRLGAAVSAPLTLEALLRSFSAASRCALLIARGPLAPHEPVVAIYEGGERGAKVLALALQLARGDVRPLIVVVPTAQRRAYEAEVRARVGRAAVAVELRDVQVDEAAAVTRLARTVGGRLWLRAANDDKSVLPSIVGVRCPVLLVR